MDRADALKMHDDLLASRPEGARHDSDICPFCHDKASAIPPGDAGRDVSDKSQNTTAKGGTNMTDISQDAHEALLKKAVEEATKATEAALATKVGELDKANTRVTELETEIAGLKTDNDQLNKDLDAAQVKLTSATEEVASLKKESADKDEAARVTELASKRGEQVKNLKLFSDDYVTEKASKWAGLTDEAWGEQLEEWKQLKPADAASAASTDTASAMTGTSDNLTKDGETDSASETKPAARRAVLGL